MSHAKIDKIFVNSPADFFQISIHNYPATQWTWALQHSSRESGYQNLSFFPIEVFLVPFQPGTLLAQECMGLLGKQHQSPDAAGGLRTCFSIRFVTSSSLARSHPNRSLRMKSLGKRVQRGGRGNGDSAFELALLQRKQCMDQNPKHNLAKK